MFNPQRIRIDQCLSQPRDPKMSWKLYEEAREPPETDIPPELDLNFSLFEPWEQRDNDLARSAGVKPATKAGTSSDVDSMMLYVQALQREGKANICDPSKLMPPGGQVNGGVAARNTKLNAKYFCKVPSCNKAFHQRRHLEIHLRSHTGERPYRCSYPSCDRSFSQQCNLKTHSRLHTGEKPFVCTLCGNSFSQKGNLTQHQLIHDTERQFVCRLDGCEKRFTQLGNLKAHHNHSHSAVLKKFTERIQGGQVPEMSAAELEMFEYFQSLYKNCNRGIRGRGKGTKNTKTQAKGPQPHQQLPTISGIQRGRDGENTRGCNTLKSTPVLGALGAPAPASAPASAALSHPSSSWGLPSANLLAPTHLAPTHLVPTHLAPTHLAPKHLAPQMTRTQLDQPFPPITQQPSLKRLLNQSEDSLPPFYVMERWKPS